MKLPRRLLPDHEGAWLFDSEASRAIERRALASCAPHALMEAAGLAVARLALALAPHARRVWVAAGPGNNGGDGLIAACWLQQAGRQVHVTWQGDPRRLPGDAAHAHARALQAGLELLPPESSPLLGQPPPDLCIDALLGLGQRRAPEGVMARTIDAINQHQALGSVVLAIDLPTGLSADAGRRLGEAGIRADATLALLTLKPGLFTGDGRDAAGEIWWDDLGTEPAGPPASARLAGPADARAALRPRSAAAHGSHKGRFGDLWVVGGAATMTGAAQLAALAGLHAGAGRVYLTSLANDPPPLASPELMQRSWADAQAAGLGSHATVVCGCGGGDAVRRVLPELLGRAPRLVLDADALNAVAADPSIAGLLEARGRRGMATVLTPHPLEAARMLAASAADVQADRLGAAHRLAQRFQAVVLLKGSGSIIASPLAEALVNPTGNARLSTAGTGDVLAGWIGGCWSAAADSGLSAALQAAAGSAWLHGRAAEAGAGSLAIPASSLIAAMADAASALG